MKITLKPEPVYLIEASQDEVDFLRALVGEQSGADATEKGLKGDVYDLFDVLHQVSPAE